MTTAPNDFRSLMTPVFVLFGSVALVVLAAMMLQDPSRAGGDMAMSSPASDGPFNLKSQFTSAPASSMNLAEAEDQLVKNMAYFDSRFERYTAELHLEEEKALSRSDLVATSYQVRSLQEDISKLQTLSCEWDTMHTELHTSLKGSQLAGSRELLDEYIALSDRSLLSIHDVTELSERLQPLSDFVAMLEAQDKVAYEPGERFQSRLTSMVRNVEKAIEEFQDAVLELKRLHREAQPLAPVSETLEEAVYRRRRQLSAAVDSDVSPQIKVPDRPQQPESDNRTSPRLLLTTEETARDGVNLVSSSSSSLAPNPPSASDFSSRGQSNMDGSYLPSSVHVSSRQYSVEPPRTAATVQSFVCSRCGRIWTTKCGRVWSCQSTRSKVQRCSSNCRCR